MAQTSDLLLKKFQTFIEFSWYKTNEGDETKVAEFKYSLTQYSPSVYATIACYIHESYLEKFSDIEKLPIEQRKVEINCLPELFRYGDNKKMFSGPWKFIVMNYRITPRQVHLNTAYGQNPESDAIKGGNHYLVELQCLDKIFYKMSINEKYKSYPGKISDNISKIISENGGKPQITSTVGEYDWNQTRETDYTFIRRMLPYAKDGSGNVGFAFYCYNEEGFFKPIDESKKNPTKIFVGNNPTIVDNKRSQTIKSLIEKFGSLDNLKIVGPGFRDFDEKNPKKMITQAYQIDKVPGQMHDTKSKKIIQIPIEKQEMMETFATSLRKAVHRFSRIIQVDIYLDTEITPLSCIEIINTDKDYEKEKLLDGLYYVIEVCHRIGLDPMQPFLPMTRLTLSSDVDFKGMKAPEGKPLDKEQSNTSSKPKEPEKPKESEKPKEEPKEKSVEDKKKADQEKRKKEIEGTEQKFKKPIKSPQGHHYDSMVFNVPLKDKIGHKFSGLLSNQKTPKGNILMDGFEIDDLNNVIKIYEGSLKPSCIYDVVLNQITDFDGSPIERPSDLDPSYTKDNPNLLEDLNKKYKRYEEVYEKKQYKTPCPD